MAGSRYPTPLNLLCLLPQRIRLTDTSSWRELDGGSSWRERLAALHDDYFYVRQDALWKAHALKTLPVLMRATDMLVCGEDLGMIPACVPPVMEQLGLVGAPRCMTPSTEAVT